MLRGPPARRGGPEGEGSGATSPGEHEEEGDAARQGGSGCDASLACPCNRCRDNPAGAWSCSSDYTDLSSANLVFRTSALPFVLVWTFLLFPPISSFGFRALAPCDCFPYVDGGQACFLHDAYAVECVAGASGGYTSPDNVRFAAWLLARGLPSQLEAERRRTVHFAAGLLARWLASQLAG